MSPRKLTDKQIETLISQGCTAEDFNLITVAEVFDPTRVRNCHFSGNIYIGGQERLVNNSRPAGVYNAVIHNCSIDDNVFINNVNNCIANYNIQSDVIIDNVDLIAVGGESTFGNGIEVIVINEAGGRETPIYDNIPAPVAYIIALYRHDQPLIDNIKSMIADYVESVKSNQGLIGKGARITNCSVLQDVKIGPAAVLEQVTSLKNATVNSSPTDPAYIGAGVIARNFIASDGSVISDGAMVENCFVGQAVELSKGFSAQDSLFFANSVCQRGEACNVFAGPYTVSGHKASLLVAGLFSFMNAGSSSTQSNHMYKIGPVHQGVAERGCKTGSFSYIKWPARIGAFTTVIGKHVSNPDIANLPFSCLIEKNGHSCLIPALNLKSVGLLRNIEKWSGRDKRKTADKTDLINFDLFTPYTVGGIIDAVETLWRLYDTTFLDGDNLFYNGVKLKLSHVHDSIDLYQYAIDYFIANVLLEKIAADNDWRRTEKTVNIQSHEAAGAGKWIDLAGLTAPRNIINAVVAEIASKQIKSLAELSRRLIVVHQKYPELRWNWTTDYLEKKLGKNIEQLSDRDISGLINKGVDALKKLTVLQLDDADKDFNAASRISYGIDDEDSRNNDFASVRGNFKDSPIAVALEQTLVQFKQRATQVNEQLQ